MMAPTPAERRRTSDVQAEAAAHLEGRMDVMEERLTHLDEKIDGVDGKVDEALATLKSIERFIHRIELEGKDRDNEVVLLKQRFDVHANGCPQNFHGNSSSNGSEEDEMAKWRKKVVDVFVIALCIVGILALMVFAEHNLMTRKPPEWRTRRLRR